MFEKYSEKLNLLNILPFLFLAIFIAQFILWRSVIFVDSAYWIEKIDLFGQEMRNFHLIYNASVDPPHPGTLILIFALIFRSIGFLSSSSLIISEVLLNTTLITSICLLSFFLFPNKLWWISIGGFFVFNNFAYYSNPIDIIVSELIVITFLCTLWHIREKARTPFLISAIMGASLGLAAASRIHITIVISLLLFSCLLFVISKKRLLFIISEAVIFGWLFIPYLWKHPIIFFSSFSSTASLYDSSTLYLSHSYHVSLADLIMYAPLAFFGFLLSIFFLFRSTKKTIIEIPKKFLLTMLIVVTLTTSLILRSHMIDIRFLYPMFFLCQIFLPLFLIDLIDIFYKNKIFVFIFRQKYSLAILSLLVNCLVMLYLVFVLLQAGFIYEKILLFTMQIQLIATITLVTIHRFDATNLTLRKDLVR